MISRVIREVKGQATHLEAREAVQDACNFIDAKAKHGWDFLFKAQNLNVVAPYTTGTVSVSAGGTAVTLSGGTWSTAWSYRSILFSARQIPYSLSAFPTATSATLANPLSGDAISGGTYTIYQDRYALPSDCEAGSDLFIKGPRMSGRSSEGVITKVGRLLFENRVGYSNYGPVEHYTDDEYDEVNNLPTIKLWPYPTAAGEYYLLYRKKLTVPATDVARFVIPESFEKVIINLAAANLMQRNNMQGWLQLDQQARELLQNLYVIHASSGAYEDILELAVGRSGAWGDSSLMYMRS